MKYSHKESSRYSVEQSETEGGREVNLRTDKQKTGLMGDLKIYSDGFWGESVCLSIDVLYFVVWGWSLALYPWLSWNSL